MRALIAASLLASLLSPAPTHAFCGFYVSGSNKKMFNDATQVVLMRSGTRTVLSMQNDYRGPLEDFAMVIPVPVVLKPTDVRVVPKAAFERLDSLGSPRLVEYWEQDPCPPPEPPQPKYAERSYSRNMPKPSMAPTAEPEPSSMADRGGSRQERPRPSVPPKLASFAVNPQTVTAGVATNLTWSYSFANEPWPPPACTVDHGVGQVWPGAQKPLTLETSSNLKLTCANAAGKDSKEARVNVVKIEAKFDGRRVPDLDPVGGGGDSGLEQLAHRSTTTRSPTDAEPLLRPYIESGSKFFVARVNPKKVAMVDGRAALSPIRFHYDSEEFSLPIRLGMANSSGKQDLIVNIVSPDRRYEVANYKNVTIPTNFDVKPAVKERFGEFYAALFDKTIEKNPGAVVTEYAWTSQPTRGSAMGIVNGQKCDPCPEVIPEDKDMVMLGGDVIGGAVNQGGFVLTRLHARYGKHGHEGRPAVPRGQADRRRPRGVEQERASSTARCRTSPQNYFQARYAIRYWWTGPMTCKNPQARRVGRSARTAGRTSADRGQQDRVRTARQALAPHHDQARPHRDRGPQVRAAQARAEAADRARDQEGHVARCGWIRGAARDRRRLARAQAPPECVASPGVSSTRRLPASDPLVDRVSGESACDAQPSIIGPPLASAFLNAGRARQLSTHCWIFGDSVKSFARERMPSIA
jgi:hypothetical protein